MSSERGDNQPFTGTYGHGSIHLTAYPSSQRVRVVLARGENHVMDMFELVQFVDQFRKPRTITTVEELDALPVGSVAAMIGSEPDAPAVACRAVRGWQFLGGDPERRYLSSSLMPSPEPITVLYEAHS